MTWGSGPLLEGGLATRARDAMAAIGRDLRAARPAVRSLDQGDAGLALAHAVLEGLEPDVGHAEHAAERMERAAALLTDASLGGGLALWTGPLGVAWTLSNVFGADPEDDPCNRIDEGVLEAVGAPWQEPWDLFSGLAGVGVYCLERLPRAPARAALEQIVRRLEELAQPSPDGVTLRTRPEWLPPERRAAAPAGVQDLGQAHGLAGVVSLLARVCEAGLATTQARPLLAGMADLLARRAGPDENGRFATLLTPEGAVLSTASRGAWCYGPPGTALALAAAGRALDREDLGAAALRAARSAAVTDADPPDASLCHGAAGLAHQLHRLWRATGADDVRQSAITWFERTLALRGRGVGPGGFPVLDLQFQDGEPGLLLGAAGVALALASGLGTEAPTWDRPLLL